MVMLVTGATGFVGSAVMRALLDQSRQLRVLVRRGSDRSNLQGLDVEVVEGDLRDPSSLVRAVAGCEVVFHVAADYRLWAREPDEIYQSNVTGTLNLLAAAVAAGVDRIVYTSSVAVLGSVDDGSTTGSSTARASTEDTPASLASMIGHYKRSKFIAEDQVRRRVVSDAWPVVIVNPSTPIGPRDVRPTPTGRLVLDAACGRIPAFVDTGLNVVHVDDVAQGHLLALEHGVVGERYILGGEDLTLEAILTQVAMRCGREAPHIKLPHLAVMPIAIVAQLWCLLSGAGEPLATVDGVRMARKKMYFSSAKAQRELGFSARPATLAIEDAVEWFRAQGRLN
ncbi:MAG: dihydroflavonol-4-reductase [Gammaproteobacteria bacterium]|jgi:dihydroflavonol-4-reductase